MTTILFANPQVVGRAILAASSLAWALFSVSRHVDVPVRL